MRGPLCKSVIDATDAALSPLGTPECTCGCDGASGLLTASHLLLSATHLKTFTGTLEAFSAAQKYRGVKDPVDNSQPRGDGRWWVSAQSSNSVVGIFRGMF